METEEIKITLLKNLYLLAWNNLNNKYQAGEITSNQFNELLEYFQGLFIERHKKLNEQ